eukprot:m.55639 g.55639  ORF g.55639 m.55639 type:complete len:96 (-) comp6944_c1_seq1:1616-1903(-)
MFLQRFTMTICLFPQVAATTQSLHSRRSLLPPPRSSYSGANAVQSTDCWATACWLPASLFLQAPSLKGDHPALLCLLQSLFANNRNYRAARNLGL